MKFDTFDKKVRAAHNKSAVNIRALEVKRVTSCMRLMFSQRLIGFGGKVYGHETFKFEVRMFEHILTLLKD